MARKNEKNLKAHPSTVAEFDLIMQVSSMFLSVIFDKAMFSFMFTKHDTNVTTIHQTTKAETRDSASCLKKQSCLPLGGYR